MSNKYCHTVRRRRVAGLLAACLFVFGAGFASALDYNDVSNLLQNNVSQDVIANMVRQSGGIAITADQETQLRGQGATETLLATMRGTSASDSITYVNSDGTTYTVPSGSTTSSSTTTYVDPSSTTYYYPSSPVVTSPPTVVYETSPTYVYPGYSYPSYPRYYDSRPGFSFSIGIGNGGRHRPNYWNRPGGGHRPPPGRPGGGGGRPGRPRPR